MKQNNYQTFIGKNKKQILEELGDEFNFYPSSIWRFLIKRDWLGRSHTLILVFDKEIVIEFKIKKKY